MFTSRHEESITESYELKDRPIRHYSEVDLDLESQLPAEGSSSNQQPSAEDFEISEGEDEGDSTTPRNSTDSDTSLILETLNAYSETTNRSHYFPQRSHNPLLRSRWVLWFRELCYPLEVWINRNWVLLATFTLIWVFLFTVYYGLSLHQEVSASGVKASGDVITVTVTATPTPTTTDGAVTLTVRRLSPTDVLDR